jgi:RNA recognition motif-containing protein
MSRAAQSVSSSRKPVRQDVRYRRTAEEKKEDAMGTKLYVGNLAYSTTNDSLQTMFAEFGNVDSAQVIMDRDTGRSKGFGFVEMANPQAGQAAIAGLNGKEVGGRQLKVNEARPREERAGGRSRY